MPKNPHKKFCQTPRCSNWAMRGRGEAHAARHCRSHRDHELGPRGAGAPKGNLNAVKTGEYARIMDEEKLREIAHLIAQHPEDLPQHLADQTAAIQERVPCPLKCMLLVAYLQRQLVPVVAEYIFTNELNAFLQRLPPQDQTIFQTAAWKYALPLGPMDRLELIRGLIEKYPGETIEDIVP